MTIRPQWVHGRLAESADLFGDGRRADPRVPQYDIRPDK